MKKLTIALLSLTIGILFLMSCDSKGSAASTTTTPTVTTSASPNAVSGKLPIAYVNMDSLNVRYGYYLSAQKALEKKSQDASAKMEKKGRALQNAIVAYQQKMQKGELTANQSAEKEKNLGQRQQRLAQEEQKLSQEIAIETQEVMDTIAARLNRASQTVANSKGYEYVFKHAEIGSMLIVAPKAYDITEEVLTILNAADSTK